MGCRRLLPTRRPESDHKHLHPLDPRPPFAETDADSARHHAPPGESTAARRWEAQRAAMVGIGVTPGMTPPMAAAPRPMLPRAIRLQTRRGLEVDGHHGLASRVWASEPAGSVTRALNAAKPARLSMGTRPRCLARCHDSLTRAYRQASAPRRGGAFRRDRRSRARARGVILAGDVRNQCQERRGTTRRDIARRGSARGQGAEPRRSVIAAVKMR
jgi:hypothetical protein